MKFGDIRLTFAEHLNLWVGRLDDTIEVELVGSKDGPVVEFAELAEKSIPQKDALVVRALAYLNEFAKPPKDLTLDAILFGSGFHASEPKKQVEFLFRSDEDFYGAWTVGFTHEQYDDSLNPVQFSRRQE